MDGDDGGFDDGDGFAEGDERGLAEDGSPLVSRRGRRSTGVAAPAAELPAVESLRIVARVRPLLREARVAVEQVGDAQLQVRAIEKNKLKRGLRKGDPPIVTTYESTQRFAFDALFWLDQPTGDVYEAEVAPLIDAVLGGANACLLAYGQTGSGKTFTLTGDPKKRAAAGAAWGAGFDAGGASPHAGLMQMASEALMARIAEINDASSAAAAAPGKRGEVQLQPQSLHVFVTAGEIYQEKLMDLGSIGPDGVKAKKLTGATLRRIPIASGSSEELIDTLEALIDRRASGATNKNDHSSRSHAVYAVHVAQRRLVSAAEAAHLCDEVPYATFAPVGRGPGAAAATAAAVAAGLGRDAGWVSLPVGSLGLVDLAGAEYASATEGCEETRRLEGGKNNLGLMSLKAAFKHVGDVAAGRTREPFSWYRSTLTRILKPFFVSPHSRLVMLVTASPEWGDAAQTAQALAEGVIIAGRPLEEKAVVELGPTADDRAGGFGRVPAGAAAAGGAGAAARPGGRPILRAGGGTGGGKRVSAVAPPPAPAASSGSGSGAGALPSGRASLPAAGGPASLRTASRGSALAAASAPLYDDDPFRAGAVGASAAVAGPAGPGPGIASPLVARTRSARATAPPAAVSRLESGSGSGPGAGLRSGFGAAAASDPSRSYPSAASYDGFDHEYGGAGGGNSSGGARGGSSGAGGRDGWDELVAGRVPRTGSGSSSSGGRMKGPSASAGIAAGGSADAATGSGSALASGRSYGSNSSAPAASISSAGAPSSSSSSSLAGAGPRGRLSAREAELSHHDGAWNGSSGVAACLGDRDDGAGAPPLRVSSASARSAAAAQVAAAARLASGSGSRRSVGENGGAPLSSYAAAHRDAMAGGDAAGRGKPMRNPLAGRPWE